MRGQTSEGESSRKCKDEIYGTQAFYITVFELQSSG